MYNIFLGTEVKKWIRDPMTGFMLVYPLIFGLMGRYLLPWLAETSDFSIDLYADLILAFLALMTPLLYGSVLAFSILDDRDDNIFISIKVTPLSLGQFLSFRLALVTILSFAATVFIILFSDIGELPLVNVISISFLSAISAPMSGLFINALSKNKIEGFAVMKGLGTILFLPVISLLFFDKKELFFAIAPGFWPAKAISVIIRGEGLLLMSYSQYYYIGLIYVILLNILSYKVFLNKTKI